MNSYLTANEIRVIVELYVMPSREEYNFCDAVEKLRQKELLENDSLDFTRKGRAVLDYILFVPEPKKVTDILKAGKRMLKNLPNRMLKSRRRKKMGKSLGTMSIYRNNWGDCSNKGISSKYEEVKVWDTPEENSHENAVTIIEDKVMGMYRIRAVPTILLARKVHTSFGGTFIYTSNGVVPHSGTPIPLHDRVE